MIVTKIVQAVNPTKRKLDELYEIARRSAWVRNQIWRTYVQGLPKLNDPRAVRDQWIQNGQGLITRLQAR